MNIINCFLIIILLFLFSNCQNDSIVDSTSKYSNLSLFTALSPQLTNIDFANIIDEDVTKNIAGYDYYYNGGGVAIGDINNDGLSDVFFTGNNVNNRLYLNKGDLVFEDISVKSGVQINRWSTGVTMVDINKDGWLDIYVCNSGPSIEKQYRTNQLFINNKDQTFSEKAKEYGIDNSGYSTQASFFDYDKDGDLDLFVMNHSVRNYNDPREWIYNISKMPIDQRIEHCGNLYQNNGNNTFSNVSASTGVLKPAFGLGLITSDLNDDGWTDIYISNDYETPDYLLINDKKGHFNDEINGRLSHTSSFSMGVDASDFNNDGLLDIGVVDMTPSDHARSKVLMASMDVKRFRFQTDTLNFKAQYMINTLQLNNGNGYYSEIALASGVAKTGWSWAPLFADFDNDGFKDYLVTNGFRKDTRNNDFIQSLKEIAKNSTPENKAQKIFDALQTAESNPITNYIYKNNGNYKFIDKSYDWGFREASFSNGVAYADLDLDGDLDLVINNIDKKAFVLKNNSDKINKHNYIRFKLLDQADKNLYYNSKISIFYDGKMQYLELHPVRGYQSSVEPILHFGLNHIEKIDSVKIIWPNGFKSLIKDITVNKTHTISSKSSKQLPTKKSVNKTRFAQLKLSSADAVFKHRENIFDDFEKEILLPHKQSMLGPFIAVGDVNGDGLQDYYIGGAKDQSGQLFIQDIKTGFKPAAHQIWQHDKKCEDMGAVMIDIDNDNDLDLYVASGGGGEFKANDPRLQDRLYINNGDGSFYKSRDKLPVNIISSGKVITNDFDNDGDMDLFVAGRTSPGKYPFPSKSTLLRNDLGKFTDVTNELAPLLNNLGMVTDAVFTDVDKDGLVDLMIVGEWMPLTYLKNIEGKFIDQTKILDLNDKTGWWSSITNADIDNDGDDDYILGNIGLNNKYHPTIEKPLHVFCNDFDDNGSLDIVLSKDYKNKLVPIRGKECSSTQMPFISDKFPSYEAYSKSSIIDIYGADKLDSALHYQATTFASYYVENKGTEGFHFKELPIEAQFAPINAAIAKDFDADGNIDLIVAGNNFQTEVETPSYDAGKGLFLKGNGDGTFSTSILKKDSGIFLPYDTKDLKMISFGQHNINVILVSNNNNAMQFLLVYDSHL